MLHSARQVDLDHALGWQAGNEVLKRGAAIALVDDVDRVGPALEKVLQRRRVDEPDAELRRSSGVIRRRRTHAAFPLGR